MSMNIEEKERLMRHGDSSPEAISMRLRAARMVTGHQQKKLAELIGIKQTTFNTQEKKGAPSLDVMRYLYKAHRIDFNFILYGDFSQLPGDVQLALFDVLSARPMSDDRTPNSD